MNKCDMEDVKRLAHIQFMATDNDSWGRDVYGFFRCSPFSFMSGGVLSKTVYVGSLFETPIDLDEEGQAKTTTLIANFVKREQEEKCRQLLAALTPRPRPWWRIW